MKMIKIKPCLKMAPSSYLSESSQVCFRLCPGIFSYRREDLGGLGLLSFGRTGNPRSLFNIACGNVNDYSVLEGNLETMTIDKTCHFGSNRPAFGF